MLRDFLSKIFSPPQPIEEPRVQQDDFARLKKRIHEDDSEPEEQCELPHGRLSEQFTQHVPLTRSVSMGASNAAHERYLQRNAAKADNWAEFDDILHPRLEPFDAQAQPASFLTGEEERELASHPPVPRPSLVEPFLKPPASSNANKFLTASLVYYVEMMIMKNAQQLLVAQPKSSIAIATLKTFQKKKLRTLSRALSQRVMRSWLRKCASMEEAPADVLRALASSTMPLIRSSVAANEHIPYDCLWALANDADASVRTKLARNPNCTIELLQLLSKDEELSVAENAKQILKSITG